MENVHDSPSPKVIGVEADRAATVDPFWILPSHGSSCCLGIESDPVARVATMASFQVWSVLACALEQSASEFADVVAAGLGSVALTGRDVVVLPLVRAGGRQASREA